MATKEELERRVKRMDAWGKDAQDVASQIVRDHMNAQRRNTRVRTMGDALR